MRITKVEIEAFRGYRSRRIFDCSADAVVLVGANGYGKTSFFDAVGWCLFGTISRLKGSRDAIADDYISNRFTDGSAEVVIYFAQGDRPAVVRRHGRQLTVQDGKAELKGKQADRWIASLLRGPNAPRERAVQDPEGVFSRCYMLGQDQMTNFLRDTNPRDRFDALSALLGTTIVREFFTHQERVLTEANTESAALQSELLNVDQLLERLRVQRDQIQAGFLASEESYARLQITFSELFAQARNASIIVARVPPAPKSLQTLLSLADDLASEVRTTVENCQKRINVLARLESELPRIAEYESQLPQLRTDYEGVLASLSKARASVSASSQKLQVLKAQIGTIGQRLGQLQGDQDDLRELLILARAHVKGDHCPVCEQSIEPRQLVRRLDERLSNAPEELLGLSDEHRNLQGDERVLTQSLEAERRSEAELNKKLIAAEAEIARLTESVNSWNQRVRAALPKGRAVNAKVLADLRDKESERVSAGIRMGERLDSLILETRFLASADLLANIGHETNEADDSRNGLLAQIKEMSQAEITIKRVVEAAKGSELEIVQELLARQQPILNALYQRLRPHPVLDQLSVEFKQFGQRGEAYFYAISGDTKANVSTIFSSAQLNAVAVCIFLSLNLAQRGSKLDFVMLDDPIQNMDDFNVLGLLDLLRNLGSDRQIFISTHDAQLGELIRRKLRPANQGRKAITHNFTSYDAAGPTVDSFIDEHQIEQSILELLAS